MDAITHVLLAHAAAFTAVTLWRRKGARAFAAAAGAAALAPDLDVFLAPLTLFEPLYFLGHRGATHSLVGAPLAGLAFLAILHPLAGRFRRLAIFRWRRGFALAALWGGWSHLLLDVVTRQGVVLAWPLNDIRYSVEWFYYLIWWLAPISLFGMWQRYRGKWSDRGYLRLVAVVLALIVIVGGVRLTGKPDGEHVYSTPSEFEWIVAEAHDNGSWNIRLVRGDASIDGQWYVPAVPIGSELAVMAARETLAYRAFLMDGTGPYVATAVPAPGGWNVTILDAVARFQMRELPAFVPSKWFDDIGVFNATVTAQGVTVHSAGR